MENREISGFSILAKGDIPRLVSQETFVVPSQNGNGNYKVIHKDSWYCECPDFTYRHVECKHIKAVKFYLKFKGKIEVDELGIDKEMTKDNCPYCNSVNITKKGLRKTKYGNRQKFLCKDCKKYFVLDPIKKHKGNGKIICLCLDLYFKGLSLRDIQDTLFQSYGIKIHHETVRHWIMKFTKTMNDYVSKIKVKPNETWETDEQMVKSKGEFKWCWNIIDTKTRFLIANQITEERGIDNARQVFKKARETTEIQPDSIITDGLWSYEKAIKREFPAWFRDYGKLKHIRKVGIQDDINNNLVERYHGTFREFDKIRRGFKGREMEIVQAFRLWYNFIRKHESLDGKTPAEEIGVNLDLGQNRWLDLLRKSIKNSN